MENKLCCLINPEYICDGCNFHWCTPCAASNKWSSGGHALAYDSDSGLYTFVGRYRCPLVGFVYFNAMRSVGLEPYHLTVL